MIATTSEVEQVVERKAEQIRNQLREYLKAGLKVFATSSFQTHSIPMLHIIAAENPKIPVVFLNTGYLFPETLKFRNEVSALLGLQIIDLRPNIPKSEQRTRDGKLLFVSDPDKCCFLNKIEPLEPYLVEYNVWVSGIRAEQSLTRKAMQMQQQGRHGIIRYHPMLNWSAREIFVYRKRYGLPAHPLENYGYTSIGCMPCTSVLHLGGDERGGRWFGQGKTECGLHTELVSKSGE